MGVMSCSRRSCDNIMCDTYVNGIGYVCYDCQAEFKHWLSAKGVVLRNETQIEDALTDFMHTDKTNYDTGSENIIDKFFNEHTK